MNFLPCVFRIIVLVSNGIEYWSNYPIRNFKYSQSATFEHANSSYIMPFGTVHITSSRLHYFIQLVSWILVVSLNHMCSAKQVTVFWNWQLKWTANQVSVGVGMCAVPLPLNEACSPVFTTAVDPQGVAWWLCYEPMDKPPMGWLTGLVPCIYSAWLSNIVSLSLLFHTWLNRAAWTKTIAQGYDRQIRCSESVRVALCYQITTAQTMPCTDNNPAAVVVFYPALLLLLSITHIMCVFMYVWRIVLVSAGLHVVKSLLIEVDGWME